ncbi:MAG: PAS domain-containing protein [Roseinatronobacter sp.]
MTDAMLLGLTIASSSTFSVLGALMLFAGIRGKQTPPVFAPEIEDQDAVFVFQGTDLIDASDRGRKLLAGLDGVGQDTLSALLAFLQPHFHKLRDRCADVVSQGRLDLNADDSSGLSLSLEFRAGLTHMRLIDPKAEGALLALDRLSFQAMQEELQTLRHVTRTAPVVAWQTDADGQIVWANDAYMEALTQRDHGKPLLTWPLPPLFPTLPENGQLCLTLPTGLRWFSHSLQQSDGMTAHFATPIDKAVQSEIARRDMMQMLTRTFASLPIGLALFDADRRLQVFNPALVDLTGLDPFFLAARPDMGQFLHNLRELRMLPEPKDFTTWRDELLRMEKAAMTGRYAEDWVLPGGATYHVTGCPQPNGAVALFMQDVTSEATIVRGFRAEIEQTLTVLDSLNDAVVAFDQAGQVVLANAAYTKLWQHDPCEDLADHGLAQAQATWAAACDPGPAIARLSAYLLDPSQPQRFTATATLRDGPPLVIQAQRLPGGGATVQFRPVQPDTHGTARILVQEHLERHLRAPDLAALNEPAQSPLDLRPRGRGVRHAGTRLRV